MYQKIKRFYTLGLYTAEQVLQFANKGVITQAQAMEIIGNDNNN